MKRPIGDYTLYRWRYRIGITIGLLLAAGLFALAAKFVPGGLRAAEIQSSIISASLSINTIDSANIVNLPFHILQQLSFMLFGVSLLGIKLPSILFAFGTLIGLFLLVKEWFRTNAAVITAVIVSTLPAFVFAAQDGTSVMYTVCLSIWLLTAGTYASRNIKPALLWKILFAIFFALNFYAPLGIYLNAALATMVIIHPHVRHFVRRLNKLRLFITISLGILILLPLIIQLIVSPSTLISLLGLPEHFSPILVSTSQLLHLLLDFSGQTVVAGIASPLLPFGMCLMMVLGVYFFIRIRYTAQNFILSIWAIILLALSIVHPENALYLLIVAMLVIASAANGLLTSWYRIFPSNPYAHVIALFPIGIIVAGLFAYGIAQYTSSYYYSPPVVHSFSSDIELLPRALSYTGASADERATLIVSNIDKPFYDTVAKYRSDLIVADTTTQNITSKLIFSKTAYNHYADTLDSSKVTQIFTNRMAENSDRFYVYQY